MSNSDLPGNDKKQTVGILEWFARHNGWLVLLTIVLLVAIWALLVAATDVPAFLIPSPAGVWNKFLVALRDGSLVSNLLVTLFEVLAGLFIGSSVAMGLGYLLAKSHLMEKILAPYLVASQAVPVVAIAPLLVIWFGSGMFSKVLICSLTVFFPVLVNTMIGFRAVPENLRDLMRSLNATRLQKLRFLEIPAAVPVLFGGLRIGATLSVIGAVVGEFVGSDRGLGFLINVGRGQYDTALVFVAIFTLILMAVILYSLAMWAEKRSTRWKAQRK